MLTAILTGGIIALIITIMRLLNTIRLIKRAHREREFISMVTLARYRQRVRELENGLDAIKTLVRPSTKITEEI